MGRFEYLRNPRLQKLKRFLLLNYNLIFQGEKVKAFKECLIEQVPGILWFTVNRFHYNREKQCKLFVIVTLLFRK